MSKSGLFVVLTLKVADYAAQARDTEFARFAEPRSSLKNKLSTFDRNSRFSRKEQ